MARFNPIDMGIGLTVVGVLAGVLLTQTGVHKTSAQMISGETDIQYQIVVRNLKTLRPDMIKAGNTLSITIRNQPRGDVPIMAVKHNPKRTLLQAPAKALGMIM
jgi:hypothetical protein